MYKILGVAISFTMLTACPPIGKTCDTSDTAVCDTGDAPCDSADTAACDTGTADEQYTGAMSLGVDTSNTSYPTLEDGTAHSALAYGCDAETDSYWYLFFTVGWSSGAQLAIYQTGANNGWNEDYHDVPASGQYGYDANGWWDSLFLSLPIVAAPGDVVLNNTATGEAGRTLFQCNDARIATLSWYLTVNDSAASSSVCTTFGEDPAFFSTGGEYQTVDGGTTSCDSVWN